MLKLCVKFGYLKPKLFNERDNIAKAISPQNGKLVVLYVKSIEDAVLPYMTIQSKQTSDHVLKLRKVHILDPNEPLLEKINNLWMRYEGIDVPPLALIEVEYIKGFTFEKLWEICVKNEDLARITKQIYQGLYVIHKAGYHCGDIDSGENIMIEGNEEQLSKVRAVVIDVEGGPITVNYQVINDLREVAFLIYEVISLGNAAFVRDDDSDDLVLQDNEDYATLFRLEIDNYPEYENLMLVLLEIFDGRLDTAEEIVKRL